MDPVKVGDILHMTSQQKASKKTTEQPSGNLTPRQVVRLAAATSAEDLTIIAESYMDIKSQTAKSMQVDNKDDIDAFKREVLEYWRDKNPDDQVQVNIIILQNF